MWFNILKESKQISRTVGSVDWEKETIPEKDETNCKEKLDDIRLSLIHNWKIPDCEFLSTTFGSFGPILTNRHIHIKDGGKGASANNDWAFLGQEGVGNVVTQTNRELVANLTEEEACEVLKDLKYIAENPQPTKPTQLVQFMYHQNQIRVIDNKIVSYSKIRIKINRGTGRTFFSLRIGEGAGMSHVNKVENSFYAYLKTLF